MPIPYAVPSQQEELMSVRDAQIAIEAIRLFGAAEDHDVVFQFLERKGLDPRPVFRAVGL